MKSEHKALLAAFVAAAVVNLVGVLFFFGPIAAADTAAAPLVPSLVGFLIYVILLTGLYDWVARVMQSAKKAAVAVGLSRFILVNVDFVLAGKRGLSAAAASAVLMVITWVAVALAYSRFRSFGPDRGA